MYASFGALALHSKIKLIWVTLFSLTSKVLQTGTRQSRRLASCRRRCHIVAVYLDLILLFVKVLCTLQVVFLLFQQAKLSSITPALTKPYKYPMCCRVCKLRQTTALTAGTAPYVFCASQHFSGPRTYCCRTATKAAPKTPRDRTQRVTVIGPTIAVRLSAATVRTRHASILSGQRPGQKPCRLGQTL